MLVDNLPGVRSGEAYPRRLVYMRTVNGASQLAVMDGCICIKLYGLNAIQVK